MAFSTSKIGDDAVFNSFIHKLNKFYRSANRPDSVMGGDRNCNQGTGKLHRSRYALYKIVDCDDIDMLYGDTEF
jgi:hypothetical protein